MHVGSLEEFQQIHVCTQNTLYELIVDQPLRRRARARRPLLPRLDRRAPGRLHRGGSFLKRLTINLGLQMEIELDRRRIITSPVRTIALLEHRRSRV